MVYELGGNMKLHDFKRKVKKAFRDPKWAVKRSRELLQEYKVNHRKWFFLRSM